ncbi:MAG TPA: zinc ribbon domain-containing protein [Thermomicrobiales bacterium]|nr:zinc ribbon domain-containing protein [Thermomicrobiales bacterium]
MEETFARALQFIIASMAAFGVALWFALAVWTFRDISQRSTNVAVQVLATLVVVLGFLPGLVIYLLMRPRETREERYQREIEETYLAQELGSLPTCPRCSRSVRDEYTFCPDCGTTLRRACASCGRLVDIDWAVCAYCGYDLPPRAPIPLNGHGRTDRAPLRVPLSRTADWEVDLDGDDSGAETPAEAERPARSSGGE